MDVENTRLAKICSSRYNETGILLQFSIGMKEYIEEVYFVYRLIIHND